MNSTFTEIIAAVDTRYPNEVTSAEKLSALDMLEHQIFRDVVSTHVGGYCGSHITSCRGIDANNEIIAPNGFEDMYEYYLEAIIAQRYGETARYNNAASAFNTRYNAFQNYWNRTHTPLQKAGYLKVM